MSGKSDIFGSVRSFLDTAKSPLVVILGPTASGKTGMSIRLAHALESRMGKKAEIINADSRQLYRYLDIGTAKITDEEKQGVAHHLLDVLDPKEEATAGWYRDRALQTIDDIHARGHVPLLVGGSMLYLSTIIDALTLEREDLKTTLRTGMKHPFLDLLIFGMDVSRMELKQRIAQRCREMFAKGWVDEVAGLLKKSYTADDPGMKSHGYQDIMAFLEGRGASSLDELMALIAQETRRYAKRQRTWWKGDSRIQWI